MHPMRDTGTWHSWASMRKRCYNENSNRYRIYGGAGITVCPEWSSFDRFFKDMGVKPGGLTIERIDNTKGYYKENCKWATYKEQANNRSNNHVIEHSGVNLNLTEWAYIAKIPQGTLRKRLKMGWDIETALNKPVRPRAPNKSMLLAVSKGDKDE